MKMIAIILAAVTAAGMSGCGAYSDRRAVEYAPDMARGPAYKAFAPNPATVDGLTLRQPVAGTVPRGYQSFLYGRGEQEAMRAGRELQNPIPSQRGTLEEGRALYQTYCLVCHGESGKGDGPIAEKIPHPPSFLSDRLLQFAPGRIFHVITMGTSKMPPYAAQLSPTERWKVVSYLCVSLQQRTSSGPAGGAK
jgi:mono/diheme cytochrome c family protein